MRKIDDQELMEMIEAGKLQKECAEHFGVSPAAINQRLKRLKACTPPESFSRLTDKEKGFVLAKVEGKTNMEAVKTVYNVTSNESAKSLATQLMREPDIAVAIADLMAQEGLPRRRRIQRLRDVIECKDLGIAARGLDMAAKMTGEYAPQQLEIITDVEIRALIASITAQPTEEIKPVEDLRKETPE